MNKTVPATSKRRSTVLRLAGAAVAMTGGILAFAGQASAETTSDTVTEEISLDTSGVGTVAAFDPALGTLTQVDWEVTTDALAQLCIENVSAEAGSTVGGTMEAGLTVTFPGSETTSSAISQTIPETMLTASDGGADCDGYDDATRTYLSPVSSPDVVYAEGSDPATSSATVTDPAELQSFVGPGTLPYSFTSSSDANVEQPSEWIIVFFADGEYSLTVTYTYTPPTGPTTTISGGGGGGSTTVPPTTVPPTTALPTTVLPTTVPGELPRTGSDSANTSIVALALAAAGGALVLLGRRRTTS